MINTITFDSQMAMAGAMSAVFAAKSGSVNESVKKTADKTQVVTESAKPIMANKPEKKATTAAPVKKVCCESDTAQSRLEKFRAAHMAKAAKKQLKTCATKVCECGTQTGEDGNATPAQTTQTAPVTEDVPENGEENAGATDAGIADGGVGGGEGEGADNGADAGSAEGGAEDGDKKELVAHASAVSERLASLKEKLVQELDADDGLKLGTQNGDSGEGDGEGDVDGGDADDDTEAVNPEA